MANSNFLRKNKNQHTVKNSKSKKMDNDIDVAVKKSIEYLSKKYPSLKFRHAKKLSLREIIKNLSNQYPKHKEDFAIVLDSSFIKPDGGFLYASDGKNEKLILVSEAKRQGTNDKRLKEGLPKQALGNAIERLGKNLTGIKAIFRGEKIIPFVCFGNGDDFKKGSSILDRVITMNDFHPLNQTFVDKNHEPFEPVSMYFRQEDWSEDEMTEIMNKIAEKSINHYFK